MIAKSKNCRRLNLSLQLQETVDASNVVYLCWICGLARCLSPTANTSPVPVPIYLLLYTCVRADTVIARPLASVMQRWCRQYYGFEASGTRRDNRIDEPENKGIGRVDLMGPGQVTVLAMSRLRARGRHLCTMSEGVRV